MSEYTREEILKMIEKAGGPENLDLSGKDLSAIDLSGQAITEEAKEYQSRHAGQTPVWFSPSIGSVNLRGADLSSANLQEANLWGANLEEASLRPANLQNANLAFANLRKAGLTSANLQKANLWGANLQNASLSTTNLRGADLRSTHLARVDMSDVESLAGAYFRGVFLDCTRMQKQQLGEAIGEEVDTKYYEAKEAYLLLKNNFNQIGRYDDASWAYIKGRQMEKVTYHPKLARKYYAKIEALPEGASPKSWTWWRFYVKYTLKWLWDWIIDFLCGYGERSLNVVVCILGVAFIIFPLLYLVTGLAPRSGQNLLPRDYFLYSLYSLASMEHPTLQAASRIVQLFTGLESLSGIALLALLMYTLGRRISRS